MLATELSWKRSHVYGLAALERVVASLIRGLSLIVGTRVIPFLTLYLLPPTILHDWKVLEGSLQETRHHLSSSSAPTSSVAAPKVNRAQGRRQYSSLLSSTPATLSLDSVADHTGAVFEHQMSRVRSLPHHWKQKEISPPPQ